MKTIQALLFSLLLCLPGRLPALETNALDTASASPAISSVINQGMVKGVLDNIQKDTANILQCQKQNQLWNGSSCTGNFSGGGTVTDTAVMPTQMMPVKTINGTVPTGQITTAVAGSRNCGLLGLDNCSQFTTMELLTCSSTDMLPSVNLVNDVIQITPKTCQANYRVVSGFGL
ncbi:MAG TPA: hypothetical protein VHP58_04365 [Alphaproteobacteria bacterium]|nr:hypothetical protein [Alphaproteobacteria bacterium]